MKNIYNLFNISVYLQICLILAYIYTTFCISDYL